MEPAATRTNEVRWRLPRNLTEADVETWLATTRPHGYSKVALELGTWERTRLFGEARLLGALALLDREGVGLYAAVPELTLAGDRKPSTPTEKVLTESVAGIAVGHLCSFDELHASIPARQRKLLVVAGGLLGSGKEQAVVELIDADSSLNTDLQALSVRYDHFRLRFGRLLEIFAGDQRQVLDTDELVRFAFEAWENTADHGVTDLDDRPIRSIRFLTLRKLRLASESHLLFSDADGATPAFAASLATRVSDYLSRLETHFGGTDVAARPGRFTLAELTVGDGGIGIPARMAQSLSVYDGAFGAEFDFLGQALRPVGTSKPSVVAGRGLGFAKMLRAAYRLRGLAILRTGRLCVTKDYIAPDGTIPAPFRSEGLDPYQIDPTVTQEAPLIGGTSVSLLFPWHGALQTSFLYQ